MSQLVTYNHLITSSARASHWQLALSLFEELRVARLADEKSLGAALIACEKGSCWSLALLLLAEEEADLIAFTAAMQACQSCSQWEAAEGLLEELQHQQLRADALAYPLAGPWRRALVLLLAMESVQIPPTAMNYTSATSMAPWPWALWTLAPDLVAYAQAMSKCPWLVALQLLHELQDLELRPDAACYSACIAACEKGQQWQRALLLLRPNVVAFGAAISACKKSQQWQWALKLLQEMQQHELRSNLVAYNAALGAFEAPQWHLALRLLEQLRSEAMKADLITSSTAVDVVSSQSFRWPLAMLLLPAAGDPLAYNPMITACARSSEWPLAFFLLSLLSPSLGSLVAAATASPHLLEEMQTKSLEVLHELSASP